MDFHFLGGAMEIGGSCIYVRIKDKGILLDSGIRQTSTKDPLPDFRTIQEKGGLDAVIVSHAHMDHIGTLPIISKAYPSARIYMTAMTADLTRVLLYDSLKIMKNREDEIPHYSEQDVLGMLGRIFPIGYQTQFPIFDNFQLTFYPAGHIAGAACVYLVTEEGSLFYSGDFSAFSQRTIEGIRIPRLRPDAAIVETTYGNRLHANRQVEEKRLTALVTECIQQEKKILIPAFALGRAQEVLLILRSAMQNQEIPTVPVYVDGMVRDINTMYTRNPTYLKNALGKRILKGNEPFYTKDIQPVAVNQNREELLKSSGPVIFVSSSGMLTGGPSAAYAAQLAPSENACIILTGYQDEESPGRQLLNLLEDREEKNLMINGRIVPVKCRIEQVGLSAHGDQSEIMALLERLSARRIFLVHGNQEAMEALGNELAAADYRRQIYLPQCGQSYEISLHNKRKQIGFQLSDTMQMERLFTPEDEKTLWQFWQKYYSGKSFTISQIAQIWYGKPVQEVSEIQAGLENEENLLQKMQHILLDSCYFKTNAKRLFLFEANTEDEVKQALEPKELTQQELTAQIEAAFLEQPYRKISYYSERKEVLLQFDYPDSQNIAIFQEHARQFTDATGWRVKISPSMNYNAAALLLSALFGDRLAKTSYYVEKKCYTVQLTDRQRETDGEKIERFQSETGWKLVVNGSLQDYVMNGEMSAESGEAGNEGFFRPLCTKGQSMEQNQAFSYIDRLFAGLKQKPDKKSLKQDSQGKYMEIGFISPMLGKRCQKQLQSAADETGWRIRISDKVNQNELLKTAQLLCLKYEIPLVKNPSYLPESRSVQLKVRQTDRLENRQKVMDEFTELTGCQCSFQEV